MLQVEECLGPLGRTRQSGDFRRLRTALRSPSPRRRPPSSSAAAPPPGSNTWSPPGNIWSLSRSRRPQSLFHDDPLPAGCDGGDGGGGAVRQPGVPALHRRSPLVEARLQSVAGGSDGSATGTDGGGRLTFLEHGLHFYSQIITLVNIIICS